MAQQLKLTHLTFIGAAVPPASIDFGPVVTLVRGPSDTGKSFIVDAIDFMLGANALKEIPESEPYSTLLLGIELPAGELVTLSRSIRGGNYGLFHADVRQGPLGVPDEVLAPKHNAVSTTNVSRFLLSAVGLEGRKVRKNVRNATDSLSFRNVAHLCIVDETQMQAETPPAFTGNYVTKTKEVSVLKMFLQDEDDSGLVEVESRSDLAKLSGAKLEVVDRLLRELEARLADEPEASELRQQLGRLNASIDEQSRSISESVEARSAVVAELRLLQQHIGDLQAEWADTAALQNRFGLLRQKYESDLARLEAVREAGTLLGYFATRTCAFCGAEPEHQHNNTDCEGDATSFGDAIDEQARRTRALADDLLATISDVAERREELRRQASAAVGQREAQRAQLADLENSLAADNTAVKELINKRASIERSLGLYDQIESLEKMKQVVVDEATAETATVAASVTLRAQREFSRELVMRLAAWGYPNPEDVRYDATVQDMIAGDQLRAAHGKGVRAVLHAAFTLGLARYCMDREIPHPGFVVLDSPLVTYRPPENIQDDASFPPADVVTAFYRDLQRQAVCQVIVMENTDPTEPVDEQTKDIVFTATSQGRYGFFPVIEALPSEAPVLPYPDAD